MKATLVFCKMKPYIQPFERELALRELRTLAGGLPRPYGDSGLESEWTVASSVDHKELAARLTYWESVRGAATTELTRQAQIEATVNTVRNGVSLGQLQRTLPFDGSVRLPNRRVLRYGPHGIHEYRGKFFPQLVRALLNVSRVRPGSIVADPMCGSGTTLVEAVRLGGVAFGLDLNPLSVFVTRTKCSALKMRPELLMVQYERLKDRLLKLAPRRNGKPLAWFDSLPRMDREYLRRWFAPEILADLDSLMMRIQEVQSQTCRNLFLVALSNILRKVSWQKEDDLRVRKEIRAEEDIDCVSEYTTELGKSVRTLFAYLAEREDVKRGQSYTKHGDARHLAKEWGELVGKVDAIITSPPYATALPYIDTDRLSLCYLGLLSRAMQRKLEWEMIGNREVTDRQRRACWEAFLRDKELLPREVVELVQRIERLNRTADVGYRRRNLAALLAKYFLDMRQTLAGARSLLGKEGHAFVVIGNNHTVAGGKRIEMGTDGLLAKVGLKAGLGLEECISMDMLVSRDIFKRNAVASETILCFRKTN